MSFVNRCESHVTEIRPRNCNRIQRWHGLVSRPKLLSLTVPRSRDPRVCPVTNGRCSRCHRPQARAGFANVIGSGDSDGRQVEAQQDRTDISDVIIGPQKWHLPRDERNYDVLRRHYFQLERRHSQIPDAVVRFRARREAERPVLPRAASCSLASSTRNDNDCALETPSFVSA